MGKLFKEADIILKLFPVGNQPQSIQRNLKQLHTFRLQLHYTPRSIVVYLVSVFPKLDYH